jgi:DNA invertase Pin-like site-specific DNA recombinase
MEKPKTPLPPDGPRLIGYARVSTNEQSVDMQLAALSKAGVHPDNMHSEQVSGVAQKRPKLDLAFKDAREGDTFVVWKLDRMGRSLLDLLDRLHTLESKGVHFRSLTEGIDTTTPGGRLIMHVMGALAQFERDLIVERTRTGVKAHMARGGKIGAERIMTAEKLAKAHKMLMAGKPVTEVASKFGVSPACIYKYFPGGLRSVKA